MIKSTIVVFSIDPGPEKTGFVVLREGKIAKAAVVVNSRLFTTMLEECATGFQSFVLIEDIKPSGVALKQSTIDTCKFIGVLEYRLESAQIDPQMIARWEVKEWIFEKFPEIAIPRINKKIAAKGKWEACDIKTRELIRITKKGHTWKPRKASFIFVDDRIVIACMKSYWNIATPKPGHSNIFGLKEHSWQALAVASVWLDRSYERKMVHPNAEARTDQ